MVANNVQLKSDAIFGKIKDRLAENPAKGKQINAVFLYKVTTTTSNGAPVKQWSKSILLIWSYTEQQPKKKIEIPLRTNKQKINGNRNLWCFHFAALDLKKGTVYEGSPEDGVKADTTLSVTDTDLVDIALGKLNPQVAFMKGKLKITGNIMLTQKLVPLLKTEAKL